MPIKLIVKNKEFVFPWSRDIVDVLRKFAKFNIETKTWYAEDIPCWAKKYLSIDIECYDIKWWRNYGYLNTQDDTITKIILKHTCYRLKKWKQVTCDEYCTTLSCIQRCRQEKWRPAKQVEEEICLAKKTDLDKWAIPRGLVMRVVKEINSHVPNFVNLNELEIDSRLRDYQIEVARKLWEQLRKTGSGVIQMATGAGKSYLAGYLAKQLIKNGFNVFMVALQLDLVYQLKKFAEQFGVKDGVYAITVQTLYRRLFNKDIVNDIENENNNDEDIEIIKAYADEMTNIDIDIVDIFRRRNTALILDEVHHLPARTVKAIAMETGDGWGLRIGMSATPWRNDGRDLEIYAVMGDIVGGISSSFLIKHGFAVPVEIRVVEAPGCLNVDEIDGTNNAVTYAAIKKAIAKCESRNKFIAELAQNAEKPVIVITQLINHANELAKIMRSIGIRAEAVTSVVRGDIRQTIYRKLENGIIDVIVATQLADEGLDLPPLRTMIIAIGGKSKTRTLQRVGRIVRPYPGKTSAVVYELLDRDVKFFEDHLYERIELYKTEPMWKIIWK